ncbi:MAG TPA: FtsQ-type POTRA domain-containing protein [Polyangiaceae bacterium]
MLPVNRRIAPPKLPPDAVERMERDAANAGKNEPVSRFRKIVPYVRGFFGAVLVAGVALGVAWSARRWVLTSTRFAITEIEVSGAHTRSNEIVVREADIALGQNVFTADLDKARASLEKDPWLHDVQIARRLPGTIMVQVTEREAAAIVTIAAEDGSTDTFLASREGELFKPLEASDPADLVVVTGVTAQAVRDDREGVKRTILRALDLAADYSHTRLAARSPLEEVHVTADGSTSIVIGKSAVTLTLGAPPFRRKLDEAARVLAEVDRRGGKADAVLLDNDARPERVVVRMR